MLAGRWSLWAILTIVAVEAGAAVWLLAVALFPLGLITSLATAAPLSGAAGRVTRRFGAPGPDTLGWTTFAATLVLGAVGAALAAPALGDGPGGAEDRNALIAYTAGTVDHSEIYVIRADGSGRRRLTGSEPFAPSRQSNLDPTWSPDGRQIAFVRPTSGPYGRIRSARLFVMNADGSGQHAITTAGGLGEPTWSPDGTRIAFRRDEAAPDEETSGGSSIRVINVDGSGEVRLTRVASGTAFDYAPAWSPDGSRIAFNRYVIDPKGQFGEGGLYTVTRDGGSVTRIVEDGADPAWSPDGRRIAFISARDQNGETCYEECSPNGELYVADANGSKPMRLTKTTASEGPPAWSPDGKRIAFSSDRNSPENGSELYSIAVDGSCMTWLTNGPLESRSPAWQPGVDRSSDPGGCGGVPRRPTVGDIRPRPPRMPFKAYWAGPLYRKLLASSVTGILTSGKVTDVRYDDCAAYEPTACPPRLEFQNASICARHPLWYGGREPTPGGQILASARFKRRGALVAYFASAGGWDVYTGTTTVTVFGASRAQIVRVVDALRPIGGRQGRLPAPAFPARDFWAKLDTVVRAYRELGSISATAGRLGIEERTVRDRLAWARLLSSYPHPRRHRCTRAERVRREGPGPQF